MEIKNKLIIGLALFASLMSCKKEKSAETGPVAHLEIRFHPTMNGLPLLLNSPYTNSNGEIFTLTILKFYSGLFSLGNYPSGVVSPTTGEPYNLSNYSIPASLVISRSIAAGTYNELSFMVGVDSARNVSGVQSGALDPANGMFWTWNSGYIFMKIEGNSPVSTEPNGKFEYHIGGFQSPNSAIRTFTARLTDPGKWTLADGQTISFDINFSVDRFFSISPAIKIAETPVCTTPGALAAQISDNIVSAFEVTNFEIK